YGEDELLNNIGNLLILTQGTNRLVDNKSLPEKILVLKQRRCDQLSVVQKFVRKFENKEELEWLRPKDISERSAEMATEGYRDVWNPWPND
ncbi:MAG: DUF1524 domain-containing protein, partial [Candidatus Uhrbacteria bacterium]|nr:DUF1524 domain-containing protein [Candidatus Uhrbacteria bacterium]